MAIEQLTIYKRRDGIRLMNGINDANLDGFDASDGASVLVEYFKITIERLRDGQLWADVDCLVIIFELDALDGDADAGAGRRHDGR